MKQRTLTRLLADSLTRPLALSLLTLPIYASELRLEFLPTDNQSWQSFLIVDRIQEAVFPGVNFSIEPRIPAASALEKLSKERLEELKAHAWMHKRSPELYLRFVRISSLAPFGVPARQAMALLGVDPVEFDRYLAGPEGSSTPTGAEADSRGSKLRLDGVEIPVQFNLVDFAQSINKNLPQSQKVKVLETFSRSEVRPKMEVLVIHGEKWASWAKLDAAGLENLKRLPFEINVRELDAGTAEARSILQEIDFPIVPVVLLKPKDKSGTEGLEEFARHGALEKRGKNKEYFLARSFSSSGVFWKSSETSDKSLQLFVMSQCPYGVAAQRAIRDAQQKNKWPEDIAVKYHYIVNRSLENGSPVYSSLHGAGELEENVRQMIVQSHMPDKLDCYLDHRLVSIESSLWTEVLESCGINAVQFNELYKAKTKELLDAEFRLGEKFMIRSSPTFLWKGRYAMVGMDSLKQIEEFKNLDLQGAVSGASAGKCAQ